MSEGLKKKLEQERAKRDRQVAALESTEAFIKLLEDQIAALDKKK